MIFGLILLQQTYFLNLTHELAIFYGEAKKEFITSCFNDLISGIKPEYTRVNMDIFLKNLQNFAEKVLSII